MGEKTETEIGILHPSDSKRVAEALLAKIEDADFDIACAVQRDSKRVAEALLAKIEDADFNIAWSMGCELENALHKGLNYKGVRYGLGEAILEQIDTTLNRVVEGCLCSHEMHSTIGDAIRKGVEDR
jgi:hypothetical protein